MFKKFIKKLFAYLQKHIWFIAGFIIGFAIVFGVLSHVYFEYWKPLHVFHGLTYKEQKASELHLLFTRNFGWSIWVGISLFALVVTFILTIWGRKIQNKQWETQNKIYDLQFKSHLHDRYEKASNMLGSEIMTVRIAGCRALMSLGKDDKNMKEQCILLLFAFIRNPYLDDEDKKKIPNEDEYKYESIDKYEDEKFNNVFPILISLRDDIQEAADSFSAIYEHYNNTGIDIEKVILPYYFWKNTKKKPITLIKANLKLARLPKAHLTHANLQEANLQHAIMEKAHLTHANLQEANLSWVRMEDAHLWDAKLPKANLKYAELGRAFLLDANLQEANLNHAKLKETNLMLANLQRANLSDADLNGANLTDTDMQNVTGLTKEQVLSAQWGYDESGHGEPPNLPEELATSPELQEWLAEPHYDLAEEEYDDDDDDDNYN